MKAHKFTNVVLKYIYSQKFYEFFSVSYLMKTCFYFSEVPTSSPAHIFGEEVVQPHGSLWHHLIDWKTFKKERRRKNITETLWSYQRCTIRWTNYCYCYIFRKGICSYDWVQMQLMLISMHALVNMYSYFINFLLR